jgi:hypothetical protein
MKKPIFVIEDTDDEPPSPRTVEEDEDPSRCTTDEERNQRPLLEQHGHRPVRLAMRLWLRCCDKRGCVSM